jgi:NTE family protein
VRSMRRAGLCLADITQLKIENETLLVQVSDGKPKAIEYQQSRGWTRRGIIDREIKFDTSTVVSIGNMSESVKGLYNAGIFNRVSMWAEKEKAGESKIVVKLEERFSEFLRIGFRVDDIYAAQILIDFRNENFLGTATELGGWVTFGSRITTGQTEFRVHRLFNTYASFLTRAFYERREIFLTQLQFQNLNQLPDRIGLGEYTQRSYGISGSIGGQISRDGAAILEYTLQNARIIPSIGSNFDEKVTLSTLRARFTLDTRDDPYAPSDGKYTDVFFDFTPQFLGNELSFSRLFFSHQENRRFSSFLTGHLRFNVGFADNLTPFSQQYNLGGISSSYSTTFYGLRLDDYRGRQIFTTGYELRYKLPVQLVVPTSLGFHYNLGNIWNLSTDIKLREFLHGFGMEILLKTPLGPARFAIAKAFQLGLPDQTTFFKFAPTVYYFVLGYEF